jgi:hypothetical protein
MEKTNETQFILRRACRLMETASADYAYGYLRGCHDSDWINSEEYVDLLASLRNDEKEPASRTLMSWTDEEQDNLTMGLKDFIEYRAYKQRRTFDDICQHINSQMLVIEAKTLHEEEKEKEEK